MPTPSAQFVLSAPDLQSCPESALPEIALIGRSNVGKSSLVNLLTATKDLAKVSSVPGKTQLINFYLMNRSWHLIDLPGYGYAKVGKKQRSEFSATISDYLVHRPNLRWLFVLLDSRLEPQGIDREFLHWLVARELAFSLVFTKVDKVGASALDHVVNGWKAYLQENYEGLPEIYLTSSSRGTGRNRLLQAMKTLAEGGESA